MTKTPRRRPLHSPTERVPRGRGVWVTSSGRAPCDVCLECVFFAGVDATDDVDDLSFCAKTFIGATWKHFLAFLQDGTT